MKNIEIIMTPSDFWAPFETTINSFSQLEQAINEILEKSKKSDRQYVWRGQINSLWAMHSSLYRRLLITKKTIPTEKQFLDKEGEILERVMNFSGARASCG